MEAADCPAGGGMVDVGVAWCPEPMEAAGCSAGGAMVDVTSM